LRKTKSLGYAIAIIAGLSFGAIPVISAFLRNAGASSTEQTVLRLLIGAISGIFVIIFFFLQKSDDFYLSTRYLRQKRYFLQGILFSLGIVAYLSAIALETPVGEAAFLIQIHPFVTLVLGFFLLSEEVTISKIVALILTFIGLILITEPWLWGSFISSLIGDLLALSNGVIYSIYLIIGTWSSSQREKISPSLSIAWVLLWGFLIGIPILFVIQLFPLPSQLTAFSLTTILNLEILYFGVLLALFGSIIPYGLIMLSNTFDVESSRQSILMLGEPVAAIILGMLLLSEEITTGYLIGGIVLLTAIVIVTLSPKVSVQDQNH
jgi:drug/metabolite transporter (DMT)-like permease